MKQIFIVIVICLSIINLQGQSYKKRTVAEKARFYTDEMVKDLSLDSATAIKVYDINFIVSTQFDSLYATKPNKEEARKGAIGIYRCRDVLLKSVLSTQQFLMFDDIQREKREKKKLEKEKAKE